MPSHDVSLNLHAEVVAYKDIDVGGSALQQ